MGKATINDGGPWMERQFTKEEAIKFNDSKAWESLDYRKRAEIGLGQELLCMPFDVLHEAVEKALGRPVFTHEFAFVSSLKQELYGEKPKATLEEILNLIPEDKRIVAIHV